jgi:hypothetical protein
MSRLFVAAALGATLFGCSTTRLIDSDVSSFGSWPAGRAPSSFAFERLPSQQAQEQEQDRLEAAALPALEHAGFKAIDGTADVRVQVALRTLTYRRGPYNAGVYDPYWPGSPLYRDHWHGAGFGWPLAAPRYINEVSLLIRDSKTQQVVYETRAQSDAPGADATLLRALFEAALKDFPHAAISPRRVTVEAPR